MGSESTLGSASQAAQHAIIVLGGLVTSILPLIWGICGLIGVWFIVSALMKASAIGGGHGRPGEMKDPIATGIVGLCLFSLALVMVTGKGTLVGGSDWSIYESLDPAIRQGLNLDTNAATVQLAVYRVLQLLGVLATARGLLIMKAVGSGQSNATMGHGATVLIGGLMMANIMDLDAMVIQTFGIRSN